MLNVCTQVLAHTPVYFYDKNISSRTILVHWINLKMTFKSYWYIYRMCCSYNTELPSFHKHIEASHRVVVVSYTETNGIPPPFLIWTKTCSGTTFFRLIARLYFFRCACIFYREKKFLLRFAYYLPSLTILYSYVKYFSKVFFYPVLIDE